jgi:hypothetical protein
VDKDHQEKRPLISGQRISLPFFWSICDHLLQSSENQWTKTTKKKIKENKRPLISGQRPLKSVENLSLEDH